MTPRTPTAWTLPSSRDESDTDLLRHTNGVTSNSFAAFSNAATAPGIIDIVTDPATVTFGGDLTIAYSVGRVGGHERELAPVRRACWDVSHEPLVRDFHKQLQEEAPFWIARAAQKSPGIGQDVYDETSPTCVTQAT